MFRKLWKTLFSDGVRKVNSALVAVRAKFRTALRFAAPFFTFALLLTACGPVPEFPIPVENVPLSTVKGFLSWLADPGGGAWLLVVFFSSWTLEYWGYWHDLGSGLKFILIAAMAISVSEFSTWLLNNPELLTAVTPFLTRMLKWIRALMGFYVAHRVNTKRGESLAGIQGGN